MSTTNTQLDLKKVSNLIYQDIFVLLDSFGLEYNVDGNNIFMKCPVHEGSDNPNGLSISLDKQIWKCWTRGCQDHYSSDIFGFVKGTLHTDSFSEALKYICKIYDVNRAKETLNGNNNICDDPYDLRNFNSLVSSIGRSKTKVINDSRFVDESGYKSSRIPSPYFISRGFREETLNFFGVRDVGIDGDRVLRHRAVIPIWDYDGVYVGYIARSTRDFIKPKYIFSRGIRKSDFLYNFHNACRSIELSNIDTLFLVEGQGDVWKLWECGVKNVVGLFGKDVSDVQRKLLLKSGVTKLIILTDNDQAGRESKIKIKRDLGRLFKLIFPKMSTKDLGNMPHEIIKENILKDLKGHY